MLILPRLCRALAVPAFLLAAASATAQTVQPDTTTQGRQQTIDGFGTCLSGTEGQSAWWQSLFFDGLAASMVRMDITPQFQSPYSDFTYNSPWYHDNPALPGPDGNNVRTYTNATDYGRQWAGRSAGIAVMGPDIDKNVLYFDFDGDGPKTAGTVAALGKQRKATLGDFKLFASMWSPAPWLKGSSGNTISGQSGNLPTNGTAWPFIWGGNFAGGIVDTSGTPRAEFDDSSLGGTGPTSAVTQLARELAAYLRGFQQKYGVNFYAVSIQNELNFETFYNSADYPLSAGYLVVLKAARAELDRYDDLKTIKIMGPEDLLGGDPYGMWQYGGGATVTHKNLQYLQNIAADSDAASAIDYFCVHGYASNGVSAAGADPTEWDWWANGWTTSPGAGIPASVKGFTGYGRKSWMTETSGEDPAWLSPVSGFPGQGAFSVAIKIHQALTTGRESGWAYWQMTDGDPVNTETLTDSTTQDASPKYVAVKHFFRYVRPGAVRVNVAVTGANSLLASGYVHDANGTLTVVLVNTSSSSVTARLGVPAVPSGLASFDAYTSSDGSYFKPSTISVSSDAASVTVPGYGVVTLFGQGHGTGVVAPDGGAASNGGATSSADASVANGGSTENAGGTTGASGSTASTGGAIRAQPGSGSAPSVTPDGGVTSSKSGSAGGCGCRITARSGNESALSGVLLLAFAMLTRAFSRRRRRN